MPIGILANWTPSPDEGKEAGRFLMELEAASAAFYRYTVTLAGGAIAISVNNYDKFSGAWAQRVMFVSVIVLGLSMLGGLREMANLSDVRNRVLENFAKGKFETDLSWKEKLFHRFHYWGLLVGFSLLIGAGALAIWTKAYAGGVLS